MSPEAASAIQRLGPPDRAEAIGLTLRYAAPDEADALAVHLIEAVAMLPVHRPAWARVANRVPAWAGLAGFHRLVDERWGNAVVCRAAARLAQRWGDLDSATRRLAVVTLAGRWLPLVAADDEELTRLGVHADESHEVRAGAVAALGRSRDPEAAPLLVEIALSASDREADGAIDALAALVAAGLSREATDALPRDGSFGSTPSGAADAAAHAALRRVVPRAAELRRRDALLVAVLAAADTPDPNRAARALFADPDAPGQRELVSVLGTSRAPMLRLAAWRWLDGSAPDAAGLSRVARAHSREDHAVLLEHAHLALRPERAFRARPLLANPQSVRAALPVPDELSLLGERARRGFVSLVSELRSDRASSRDLLVPLLADPLPGIRLAAANAVGTADVSDWCFDPSAPVARHAVARWVGAADTRALPDAPTRTARLRVLKTLVRSPHAAVRRAARHAVEHLDPWSGAPSRGAVLLRRWFDRAPDDAIAAIRARAGSGAARDRIAAIARCARAGLAEQIADLLLSSVRLRAPDLAGGERIAATAVHALADVAGTRARSALTAALDHPDPRVRANAVEALDRRSRRSHDEDAFYSDLVELKGDNAHRTRANAVRALLATPDTRTGRIYEPAAVEALDEMLTDVRSDHRLAAAWLAERTLCSGGRRRLGGAFDTLTRRVAVIARDDPDERVRSRGARCAGRLLIELRADGFGRAAPTARADTLALDETEVARA